MLRRDALIRRQELADEGHLQHAPTCFRVDLHVALHDLQRVHCCLGCHASKPTIQQRETRAQITARLARLLCHMGQVPLLQHNMGMHASLRSLRKLTTLTTPTPVM